MAKKDEPVETILSSKTEEVLQPEPQPDQTEDQARPILSEAEVAAEKAKARREIEAKRKQKAKDSIFAEELRRLEREEGLTALSGVANQMVQITIDLYEGADRIVLSGTQYFHGRTYTVPRHIADTIREIQYRCWDQERIRKGDDLRSFYAQKRATTLSPVKGTSNAPRAAA